MAKKRPALQSETVPAAEPIDAEAWVPKYVRALLEAERAEAADVAPAPVPAVRLGGS